MQESKDVNSYLDSLNENIEITKKQYPDGRLWAIEAKLNGKLHGKQFIFSRDGEVYSCLEYNNGNVVVSEELMLDN